MLDAELRHFHREKEHLLRHHKGQFVVIKGSEIVGAYTTFGEALDAAVARYGPDGHYLIRQVTDREPVVTIPALAAGVISADL